MVISFLPAVHCDTWFKGISKALLLFDPTSKLKTDPLNLAVPQFQPFKLSSFSSMSILYECEKNLEIFSFSESLKPTYLYSRPVLRNIRMPKVPAKFWKLTTSMSDDWIWSTFPVLLFLNTMLWSVIFSLPGVWKMCLSVQGR